MSDMDNANLGDGGNNDQNNDGGNNPPAWTAQLDKDLQGNERLTSFKTIGEMGKAFLDTEGKLQNALFIPGEKATDEERAAFYQKLGRPESAEKYNFSKPEGLPADVPYSTELETAFKAKVHSLGLNDTQAKEIFNWYHNDLVIPAINQEKQSKQVQAAAEQAAFEKAVDDLKTTWKGDDFKLNSELASKAFNKIAEKSGLSEEALKFIHETKVGGLELGNHPTFLKMFAFIGKTISDDTFNGHSGGGAEFTKEQLAKEWFPNSPNMHK